MSHTLWAQLPFDMANLLNALAAFLALMGAWLCLATRWREQRSQTVGVLRDTRKQLATAQVNRFFYVFGAGCLISALALSQLSTQMMK